MAKSECGPDENTNEECDTEESGSRAWVSLKNQSEEMNNKKFSSSEECDTEKFECGLAEITSEECDN